VSKTWQQFIDFILDIIFPKYCVNCGRLNCFICEYCFEQIEFYIFPIKLKLENKYLDEAHALFKYQQPASKLITTLKYQSVKNLGFFLGKLIYECIDVPNADLITFVPIHKKRFSERGFNQTELIAQKLADSVKIPHCALLNKSQNSKHQASLKNKTERLKNLSNSFTINPKITKNIYQNKTILIIDDVLTTGATLNECAKVLKENGIKKVIGLTVAHEN